MRDHDKDSNCPMALKMNLFEKDFDYFAIWFSNLFIPHGTLPRELRI